MGKARTFANDSKDAVYQKEFDDEVYASATQQNSYNLGSTQFSDQSGIGNFPQSGNDQRKADLTGALFRGNIGFELQTVELDVGTSTLDLLLDASGDGVPQISTDRIVSLSSGTTGDLETILGAQRQGHRLTLFGIAGNTITIIHTAAATPNTIVTPDGSDFTFLENMAVSLVYDITLAKWRIVSGSSSGGGDVFGPGSSTDNAIVRWDGITGTMIQDSGVILTDADGLENVASLEIVDSVGGLHGIFQGLASPPDDAVRLTLTAGNVFQILDNITNLIRLDDTNGLDVFSHDIRDVDRLRFIQNTGTLISVADPTIYVDNIGAGDLVINNVDTEAIIFSHSNVVGLQATTTTLQKETNGQLARFRLYETGAVPTAGNSVGDVIFSANRTTSGLTDFAIISGVAEDIGDATREGGLAFQINQAGSFNIFMQFNDAENDAIEAFRDIQMNNNDINQIQALGFQDIGGQISVADDAAGFNFVTTSDRPFRFTPNATNVLDIDDGGIIMLGSSNIAMGNNNITGLNQLAFNETGQTITDGVSALTVAVGSGDTIDLEVNSGVQMRIDDGFVDLFNQFVDISNLATPANPAAGTRRMFVDSGTGELSVRTSGGTTVSLETGGGGSQTPWLSDIDADGFDLTDLSILSFRIPSTGTPANTENAIWSDSAGIRINTASGDDLTYVINGTEIIRINAGRIEANAAGYDLGSATTPFSEIHGQRYRIETGGTLVNNLNNIISDSGGTRLNVPTGDSLEFVINGTTNMTFSEDEIEFQAGRAHVISATNTSLQLLSENQSDSVQFWTGTGRTNETIFVGDTTVSLLTEQDQVQASLLQLIQNNNTPADDRTIANLDFMAENSASANEIYTRISGTSIDITSGTEDGQLQLGVVSGGTLIAPIQIEGNNDATSDGGLLGFFGSSGDSKNTVTGSRGGNAALASLLTALEDYGLIVDSTT